VAEAQFGGAEARDAEKAAPPGGRGRATEADSETQTSPQLAEFERLETRLRRARIPLDAAAAAAAFQELNERFQPEAIITSTDVMALAATRAGLTQPFLADYFGDPLAERQMQAAAHGSDAAIFDAWAYLLPVLLRADHFTVCSNPQRFALLGQLGAAGRLNQHTCGRNLVDVCPQGLSYESRLEPAGVFHLRGEVVPREAVVVLFLGGYNTWLDEENLFLALEETLARDPAVHFVSTGGALGGHVTVTFERFQRRVAESRYRERYHFLGWVPLSQIGDICGESDIAINLDRWSLEAELGLRTRLYAWMRNGVAIVSTAISEELRRFADLRLLRAVPWGDARAVAEALLDLAARPEDRRAMSERAREFIEREWTAERLLAPLVRWAEEPGYAPDRLAALGEIERRRAASGEPAPAEDSATPLAEVENALARSQREFLELGTALERERLARQEAEERLARLEGSRAVRIYKRFFRK